MTFASEWKKSGQAINREPPYLLICNGLLLWLLKKKKTKSVTKSWIYWLMMIVRIEIARTAQPLFSAIDYVNWEARCFRSQLVKLLGYHRIQIPGDTLFWVHNNNSLTWIEAIKGDDFPIKTNHVVAVRSLYFTRIGAYPYLSVQIARRKSHFPTHRLVDSWICTHDV